MKLRRIALWLLLALGGCAGMAAAQSTLSLTDANITDAANNPFSGQIQICPVLSSGVPTWFHYGGGGVGLNRCATVTASGGSFTATVPDTYLTNPQNLCLAIHAWDPATNQDDLNMPCVQPSIQSGSAAVTNGWCTQGGSCDLTKYSAAIPALGQVNLNLTGGGGTTFTGGNVSGATTFGSTVTLSADPTLALQAATKQYVDARSSPLRAIRDVTVSTTAASTDGTIRADPATTSALTFTLPLLPVGTAIALDNQSTYAVTIAVSGGASLGASVPATISAGTTVVVQVGAYGWWDVVSSSAGSPNWAAPGAIGSTTPSTGAFTSVTAQSVSTNAAYNGGFLAGQSSPAAYPPAPPANSFLWTVDPSFTSAGVEYAIAGVPSGSNTVMSCAPPVWKTVTGGTGLVSLCTFVASGGSSGSPVSVSTFVAGGNEGTSGTTFTTAQNSSTGGPNFNMASGNSLLVGIAIGGSATVQSVTDLAGCTFAQVGSTQAQTGSGYHFWYLANNCTTGSSSDVVTVTTSSSATYSAVSAYQIADSGGTLVFDAQPALANATATSVTTATFSTQYTHDVVACDGWTVGSTGHMTAGTGFTVGSSTVGGAYMNGEYETFSSAQSGISGSFSYTSSTSLDIACIAVGH